MDWTEGHSDCRAGRVEKSKFVAERSRGMAEKTGRADGRDRASVATFSEPWTWTISLVNSEM